MYEIKNGVLTCVLPNGCLLQQDKHPETNEPITEKNATEVLKACLTDDQWLALKADKYEKRIQSSSRLIAEMAVENEQRLKSGEWTVEQLQTVIKDPQISELVRLLQMANFQTAISVIHDLQGSIYTDDLKKSWIEKIQAAS